MYFIMLFYKYISIFMPNCIYVFVVCGGEANGNFLERTGISNQGLYLFQKEKLHLCCFIKAICKEKFKELF